jgi:arylsulfatase A-like enzyme
MTRFARRLRPLPGIFLVCALLGLPPVAKRCAAADDRPNIVVIMADDLGWSDLHCQGNELLDTPNIDHLAEQGMRFTDAYAAAPVCTPTRAAMMTGLAPARLAITNHAPGNPDFVSDKTGLRGAAWTTYLALDQVTIAERLRAAGYQTGFIGKWHLSHRPGGDDAGKYEPRLRPEHQGFDSNVGGCSYGGPPSYFEPYRIPNITPRRDGDYLPERLADEAIGFLEHNQDKPFFLCWWNYSVHYPIQAPEDLVAKYKSRGGLENPGYAAMIEGMDTAIGRVLKSLRELNLESNTLLIFTSDNGSLFGNQPLRRNKGHLYEGGIRVPWIVRWPGHVPAASTCRTPVISMDTVPTILDAVGLKYDAAAIDGESLLPLLKQTGTLKRNALYFHYPNYAFHKSNRLGAVIRQDQYKLIRWYDDDSVELYDLVGDLSEKTNIAGKHPELTAKLRVKLDTWLTEAGARMPEKVR